MRSRKPLFTLGTGVPSAEPGQFHDARGVTFDIHHRIFVADLKNNKIRSITIGKAFPRTAVGSARNRLEGTVIGAVEEAGLVRIALDCGFFLRATLTRQSCEELDIRAGTPIEAMIKAPNVHLIPRIFIP